MKVIVIGGGLIGSACAVRLQAHGAQVTLIDSALRAEDRASFGNATMIASELVTPLAGWPIARKALAGLLRGGGPLGFVPKDIDLWGPWGVRYLAACGAHRQRSGVRALTMLCADALPAWSRLLQDIDRPDLLDLAPHVAVWESAASLHEGRQAVHAANNGPTTVRDLALQEAATLRRGVSDDVVGGVCFDGTARIRDPGDAVEAVHRRLQAHGGRLLKGEAEIARREAGDSALVRVGGAEEKADLVVIAAGAHSAPLCRQAGLTAPLIAERGYHLQYDRHDLPAATPALVFEDRFICVVQVGAALRVTGFTEIGRPTSPPDPRKWARLERHVAQLGLPVHGRPRLWMGSRPTLPDFLPAIGRRGRVLYAFGHQHIGLTLAATTAEAITELAGADTQIERFAPFRLERFGRPGASDGRQGNA